MSKDLNETLLFKTDKNKESVRETLILVSEAMKEKGYKPINQLIGYILSGDPTYITSHKDARKIIRKIDRDELLEEIIRFYFERNDIED